MNTIMSFSAFLTEKRKNPTLNPKVSILKQLEPYFDDPDIYISMRDRMPIDADRKPKPLTFKNYPDFNKLGINPKNEYNTPIGVYAYKLSDYKEYISDIGGIKNTVPFKSLSPFVYIFKPKPNSNIVKLGDITEKWLINFINKTIKHPKYSYLYPKGTTAKSILEIGEDEAIISSFGGIFWWFTHKFGLSTEKWNKFFRDFGIDGVEDNEGEAIIHQSEPFQTVFFDATKLKVLKLAYNKNYQEEIIGTDIGHGYLAGVYKFYYMVVSLKKYEMKMTVKEALKEIKQFKVGDAHWSLPHYPEWKDVVDNKSKAHYPKNEGFNFGWDDPPYLSCDIDNQNGKFLGFHLASQTVKELSEDDICYFRPIYYSPRDTK